MLLTISTARAPTSDLSFLLHKHPDRVQTFSQSVGQAHVFYPRADPARFTAALLLEVDPIALVRGRRARGQDGFALGQYVNDRPYAASSMMAVVLKDVFRTAMNGQCDARPEAAAAPLPLEITIPALPCRGGADLARRVFEPLGWRVQATASDLDPEFPDWGESRYLSVHLAGEMRLKDALNHLYVLLPVLDDTKHYWVTAAEIDKLIRAGEGWLATHPARPVITSRYLAHRRELTESALARLAEADDADAGEIDNALEGARDLTSTEKPVPLSQVRRGAVLAALRSSGARRVGDLGCGEGALVRDLLADSAIEQVVATDVSSRALRTAASKLRLDRMTERQRARLEIFQSSLTYRDDRLARLDAAVLMEVIEHVDPPRLDALERAVFAHAAPGTVIVTTPNVEHNIRFESLPAGTLRHADHRFEWTRAQLRDWASRVAAAHGYDVRYLPVGPDDPEVGPPTQMAVFTRKAA